MHRVLGEVSLCAASAAIVIFIHSGRFTVNTKTSTGVIISSNKFHSESTPIIFEKMRCWQFFSKTVHSSAVAKKLN